VITRPAATHHRAHHYKPVHARWMMRWKPVINAFAITFNDRWPAAETH
jgi:hypothetical protein